MDNPSIKYESKPRRASALAVFAGPPPTVATDPSLLGITSMSTSPATQTDVLNRFLQRELKIL
ncbi:MAG: hypothetical protein WDN07_00800 [Actinomycetota bacterium]